MKLITGKVEDIDIVLVLSTDTEEDPNSYSDLGLVVAKKLYKELLCPTLDSYEISWNTLIVI